MASIDRTAYPRFRGPLTDAELEADFTLSADEETFVRRHARGEVGRLSLAVSLKTRQWLGYFPALNEVPEQIRVHMAEGLGLGEQVERLDGLDQSRTLYRYHQAIRTHLGSRPFSHGGREVVIRTVHRAARVMSDPADLISAAVEALVKERIELPAFSNLDRLIGNLRQAIHEEIYRKIDGALSEDQRRVLDTMLELPPGHHLNAFSRLKETPGPANLKHVRLWIDRLAELDAVLDPRPLLGTIPHTNIRQFAAEAKALETGDLRDVCQPGRRYTLLLCLLNQTQTETRDQLVEMFIRRMRRTRNRAIERLHTLQKNQRAIEEELLSVFGQDLIRQAAQPLPQGLQAFSKRSENGCLSATCSMC